MNAPAAAASPALRPGGDQTATHARAGVILIAFVSLLAKLYCAAKTIGTSDVALFFRYAEWIHTGGLLSAYAKSTDFNHTPLTGWFIHAIYGIAGNGKEKELFATLLRLPAIFADVVATGALLWVRSKTGKPSWLALALFAGSPVAFMISGYHGNLDSVVALAVLLAGVACVGESPILCGVFLGLGCNIKIIPLLVAPVFFFYWLSRGRAGAFLLAAVLTTLAGWAYLLFTIPELFLRNILGYPGFWGFWGITYLLRLTGSPFFHRMDYQGLSEAQVAIAIGLKVSIVVLALGVAWVSRRCEPAGIFRTLAIVWAVFFSLTPGFGVQYLAWIAPCLLVASDRWYAMVTAGCSIALFVFYNSISGGMPWYTGFAFSRNLSRFTPWFLLPWILIGAYLAFECWTEMRKWNRKSAAEFQSSELLEGQAEA